MSNTALSLFSQVVTSRRVTDQVVSQLDLTGAYQSKTADEARRKLLNRITLIADRKSNLVSISVEDRVPTRATAIAQSLGNAARTVNNEIWSARSTDYRKRLEARLTEVTQQLNADEEAMRAFRDREHVVDLPEQVKASVGEATYLERMKNERKVTLHFNQGFAGAEAPEARRSQLEAGSAQAALSGLVHGNQRGGPLLPLDNVPRIEQEHARLKRETDAHSITYELLVRQVEMARATEARPAGRAELLDAPSEPRLPVRPSRALLLVEGLLAGLLFGLLLAVWPRTPFTRLKTDLPRTVR
jgi:tyrosine-protein kinase Etk/Wzc